MRSECVYYIINSCKNNKSKLGIRFRLFILELKARIMKYEIGTYALLLLAHEPRSFSYQNLRVLVIDWKARHNK